MSAEYFFGEMMEMRNQAQCSPYERWLRDKFPEALNEVLEQLAGIYAADPDAPAEGKPEFKSTYRRMRNVQTQLIVTGQKIDEAGAALLKRMEEQDENHG